MHQGAVDPFAWSLDSVISTAGVAVSLAGAVTTVLFAWLALKATNRANRAEEASRARAERAALSPAVATYLATWEARDAWDVTAKGLDASRDWESVAAGVSDDARRVVDWMIGALERLLDETVTAHRGDDSNIGEQSLRLAEWGGRIEARRRVDDWVATGVLNDSPLMKLPDGPLNFTGRYPRPRGA